MKNQLNRVDISWRSQLKESLLRLDRDYLELLNKMEFFPKNFFAPFQTLSKPKVKYILFGQDPYPRLESATGYSFIDGKVKSIFSDRGLSKEVNRATSLRNFIKMLLNLEGFSYKKENIIYRENFIKSIYDLRDNFEKSGILLLNIVPIFTKKEDFKWHFKNWREFNLSLLKSFEKNEVELILFGNFAKEIVKFDLDLKMHIFEHPYNISFIENREVLKLFSKMNLLYKK